MTYILGISCYYHDSSATLLKDNKIIASVQEERFTRKKHDNSFPINAIKYCLKEANITSKELDYISFYEKPLLKFERILFQHIFSFPKSLKTFINNTPSWINEKLKIVKTIKKKLNYKKDIIFIPHHLSHIANSYLTSDFNSAAFLSLDGVGEWSTTCIGIAENLNINIEKELHFPDSLGLFYSTMTTFLGFSANNSEYKMMGLSAYGNKDKKTNPYYQKLKSVFDIKNDGSFKLNMKFFKYHYSDKMPSKNLEILLNQKIRTKNQKITKKHEDIAAATQLIYEEILFLILNNLQMETKEKNLILTGGCALNSVANGKILEKTKFKNLWINPEPGDGGTSLGCALYTYNKILKNKKKINFENAYLGPNYSNSEIELFLKKNNIKFKKLENTKIVKEIAKLINENKVIGWFQGRMEYGPRALGNRSILTNPMNPKAKELLNLKIKFREEFRPFAPVIVKEKVKKFFEIKHNISKTTDYMLMVYPIKKKWHKIIPSVTHIDGSGRLQTITKKQNFLYYNLIKEFEKLTKIPILINTSFNIRGEPIVCSPKEAYNCFKKTKIDYLVLNNYLIEK